MNRALQHYDWNNIDQKRLRIRNKPQGENDKKPVFPDSCPFLFLTNHVVDPLCLSEANNRHTAAQSNIYIFADAKNYLPIFLTSCLEVYPIMLQTTYFSLQQEHFQSISPKVACLYNKINTIIEVKGWRPTHITSFSSKTTRMLSSSSAVRRR